MRNWWVCLSIMCSFLKVSSSSFISLCSCGIPLWSSRS